MNISVVIPTIGGRDLNKTIGAIRKNSLIPNEVLICIPASCKVVLDSSLFEYVRVVYTEKKGQVYQRKIGFLQSKGDFVLQLDDDIVLQEDAIENLVNHMLTLNKKSAISPNFYENKSNVCLYRRNVESLKWRVVHWIMNGKNGFKPGIISLSGVNFGLYFKGDINESEWLPGGCVLHRRSNLIVNDYYPFIGKAYAEDIIHSILLKKNNIKLYVCQSAIAYVEKPCGAQSLVEFFRQYNASKYVNLLLGKRLVRLRVYYFINFFYFVLKKIRIVK